MIFLRMCRNENAVTNDRRVSVTRADRARVRFTVEDAAEVVHRQRVLGRLHECREAIRGANREVAQEAQLIR
jgi:hypothetical protein